MESFVDSFILRCSLSTWSLRECVRCVDGYDDSDTTEVPGSVSHDDLIMGEDLDVIEILLYVNVSTADSASHDVGLSLEADVHIDMHTQIIELWLIRWQSNRRLTSWMSRDQAVLKVAVIARDALASRLIGDVFCILKYRQLMLWLCQDWICMSTSNRQCESVSPVLSFVIAQTAGHMSYVNVIISNWIVLYYASLDVLRLHFRQTFLRFSRFFWN